MALKRQKNLLRFRHNLYQLKKQLKSIQYLGCLHKVLPGKNVDLKTEAQIEVEARAILRVLVRVSLNTEAKAGVNNQTQ